jgi:hypothetical protein
VADERVEAALRDLEVTANNFAMRLARMAEVRARYVQQIQEMSQSIRQAVQAGELSAENGAKLANEMRNQIMEMQRLRDLDLGRALARQLKSRGLTLEDSIAKSMSKLRVQGRPFAELSGSEQRMVLVEVIESSGRSRGAVTAAIPKLRWAGRGLWLATVAIAAYNIGTAENPWWQSGREGVSLAGGFGGGFAGGAAMGAAGGVWAGPAGVAVGVIVGGILGALLADRAYVEAAGASNPATRGFISRFTSFWPGLDHARMARTLAIEHRGNPGFVKQVLQSLDEDYNADADDVAELYVFLVRGDPALATMVRGNPDLRAVLIRLLTDGWTTPGEIFAATYLRHM